MSWDQPQGQARPDVTLRSRVRSDHDVGYARRRVVRQAEAFGFADRATDLAIVATELASNLVRHAGGGELLVCATPNLDALTVLSVDNGVGIVDIDAAVTDHFSTAALSAGLGLGAVARLSDRWAITSTPGVGTVVGAHFARGQLNGFPETFGISAARADGPDCGDGWLFDRQRSALIVVDGLGHGARAAAATTAALALFRRSDVSDLEQLMFAMHAELRSTVGASILLGHIRTGTCTFVSVGNCSARLIDSQRSRELPSWPGTVGQRLSRTTVTPVNIDGATMLVAHTDGISGRWRPHDLEGCHPFVPMLVAATLYRDFRRPTDDTTVVATSLVGVS